MIADDPRRSPTPCSASSTTPRCVPGCASQGAQFVEEHYDWRSQARASMSSCGRHSPSRAPAGGHDLQAPASAPMTRRDTPAAATPVFLAVASLSRRSSPGSALLARPRQRRSANGYLAVLTVASRTGRRRTAGGVAPAGHRIAVLVPAHDEEPIIGSTVGGIVGQDYPTALRTVHVVADNCTDRTAEVTRRHHGAEVHVRDDPQARGEEHALGWLVQHACSPRTRGRTTFVVIDADTTMQPSFLRQVDTALGRSHSAWQGEGRSVTQTSRRARPSASRALILRHYIRPLGRTALGGSTGLFGNGMVFRTDLLGPAGGFHRALDGGPRAPARAPAGWRAGRLPPRRGGRSRDADDIGRAPPSRTSGGKRDGCSWPARFVPELARRPRCGPAPHTAPHTCARGAGPARTAAVGAAGEGGYSHSRPRPPAFAGWVGPARAGSGAGWRGPRWPRWPSTCSPGSAGPGPRLRPTERSSARRRWRGGSSGCGCGYSQARPDEVRWTRTQRNQP